MNLDKSKLLLIITAILAVLVVFSLIFLSLRRGEPPTFTEEAAEQEKLLFDQASNDIPDPKLLIFDDLIIGKSTDDEIKAIQGLKNTTSTSEGIEFAFPSPLVDRDNLAITQNGVLVFKRFITMKDVDHWESPSMIAYKEKYGEPEIVRKGSVYYGAFDMLYLWATQGLAIIGNDYTDEVKEIHVFEPMSTESYFEQWGQDSTEFVEEKPEDHTDEIAL